MTTSPTSLILSSGITAAPVLLHLYSYPLHLHLPTILSSTLLDAFALQLSQPKSVSPPQIHQITLPIATTICLLITYFTSPLPTLLLLLPLPLFYYALFSIPATSQTLP